MNVVPAATLASDELARLFTAGYEGYFVPLHVDESTLRWMIDAWDIDLDRSVVAPREGVALLGIRGERGWVGGLGVVPASRRRGVGRALMQALLADAPPTVRLEVIEQNEPAIRLYENLGFEHVRMLEVWSLTGAVDPAEAREVEPRPLAQTDLPWQRQDESLPPEYQRLETGGGEALIRVNDARVSVLQLRADTFAAAKTLIAAARSYGASLQYANVPEGDPASEALRELGAKLDVRQVELELSA